MGIIANMTSVLTRVKDMFAPASASTSPSKSKSRGRSRLSPSRLSPTRRTRRRSEQQDRIPPEPVQQRPDGGELHGPEAGPALQAHNLARANKMVPKLEWDDRLAHDAETYAKLLASTGVMEHAGQEAQGENLFVTNAIDVTFEGAVKSWIAGEQKYKGEAIGEGGDMSEWEQFSKIRFGQDAAEQIADIVIFQLNVCGTAPRTSEWARPRRKTGRRTSLPGTHRGGIFQVANLSRDEWSGL